MLLPLGGRVAHYSRVLYFLFAVPSSDSWKHVQCARFVEVSPGATPWTAFFAGKDMDLGPKLLSEPLGLARVAKVYSVPTFFGTHHVGTV